MVFTGRALGGIGIFYDVIGLFHAPGLPFGLFLCLLRPLSVTYLAFLGLWGMFGGLLRYFMFFQAFLCYWGFFGGLSMLLEDHSGCFQAFLGGHWVFWRVFYAVLENFCTFGVPFVFVLGLWGRGLSPHLFLNQYKQFSIRFGSNRFKPV